MIAFTNARVFTGEVFLNDHTVIMEKDTITDVRPSGEQVAKGEVLDVKGDYLVPAYIDLQIYGGNGLLFGEYPSVDSLTATYKYSFNGGASHIMPTIATNAYEKIFEAIDAVAAYWKQGLPGVLGLHVEGPYINPIKKGAHVEKFIRRPEMDEVVRLLEKGKGIIKIITLAPEVCDPRVIRYIQQQGIIVSAGHSNATYEQASLAFANGIPAATHLYNAMSPLQHRGPGLVGAVFNAATAKASIIADGHHVDFAAIRIAKTVMRERLFYITDAVTENEGSYPHKLAGDKYVVADGTLSGSALTMLKSVKNGIAHAGITLEESCRMGSLYPWQLLGKDDQQGMIRKKYKADLLWLNESLELKGIYTQSRLTRF
jgi:N-acetylglucosamine-6-phosphate deacetylase